MYKTISISLFFAVCSSLSLSGQEPFSIIPLPVHMEAREGKFLLGSNTRVALAPGSSELTVVADFWAAFCKSAAGLELQSAATARDYNLIEFAIDKNMENPEAYRLEISPQRISISARAPEGAFYAVQTLRQLLPTAFETAGAAGENLSWLVPAALIEDAPRFPYRGMHLDVGRHFFPVEFIKRYIDLLAMHKFNRFHWHLTEDQGWRIEIKKYPKLQEIAAWRKETLVGHYSDQPHQFDGKRYGGYYTQDEVREVVRYAAERHITVIPEIELPGHSLAALSAYPELACTPGPFEAATKWGIFEDVFCPKEETFEFLQNVLSEVIALFPSEYIHIGGDECPKTRWQACAHCQALIQKERLKDEHELQSYFIRRIERFLNSKGRQIIGWDEILEGGLAPNATVMSWRGISGGIAAAKEGHKVIMTPTSHCYLDYYQDISPAEPLAIGGYLPLEKVYGYEPVPEELTPDEARFILGAQGNVWTEYMPTTKQVEYMAFPRAIAIAELTWTPKEKKNFDDFSARLARHFARLDAHMVNYSRALYNIKADIRPHSPGKVEVNLSTLHPSGQMRYRTAGDLDAQAPAYSEPIVLDSPVTLQAMVFDGARAVSAPFAMRFEPHLAAGRPIVVNPLPSPSYNLGGPQALVNGVAGSNIRYGDREWLGWSGKDVEATIDLGAVISVAQVQMRFFNGPGQWIYLPRGVEVWVSNDGQKFKRAGRFVQFPQGSNEKTFSANVALKKKSQARFIRVQMQRHGIIAAGRQGAGHEAWLFVDEIQVK